MTRALAAFSCVGMLLFLTGCGGASETSQDGAVQLTYWRTLTGPAGEAQDELVKRFNEAHPDIHVTSLFQGGYSDLATKLLTAARANRGPDVTQLGTFEIREFAKAGMLLDLTPILGELDTVDWPGTLIDAGRVDDGLYWLPFNVSVPVLYYDKTAFADAGLDGPPQTWDEFFAYARRLTSPGGEGKPPRTGMAFWRITWPFISMIWSEGGELTDKNYTNITLNDPMAVEVMTQVQALVREGAATLPDIASGGHRAAFLSGQAAMILDSPQAYGEVMESGRDVGIAPYPAGKAGRVYAPGGGGLAVSATIPTEKRAAAQAFIEFMLSSESLAYFAQESGYLAFTPGSREIVQESATEAQMVMYDSLDYVRGDFSVNLAPPVRAAFDEAFQRIVTELAPVEATLDAADAKAEKGLAEGAFSS
ncbi:MAG: ABC transporter substrate-binding protein [Candidatus Hydrogenedentes bacterium]|nr:ABC transporter substrate-binding protein [Candidatus Hydrogenedentota bacterium]